VRRDLLRSCSLDFKVEWRKEREEGLDLEGREER
jgi:hypothetical protein